MKDFSPEQFEAELRRQKPATAPAGLLQRLKAVEPETGSAVGDRGARSGYSVVSAGREFWFKLGWWLAPATVVVIASLVLIRAHMGSGGQPRKTDLLANTPAVKADDIEIQSELVSSFDTVARLPSGEPVRYRCREWVDEVTLRDRDRGIMVEKRTPRVEVIPVSFETY